MVRSRHRLLLPLVVSASLLLAGCASQSAAAVGSPAANPAPQPVVAGLSATGGSLAGGETLTITGSELAGVDRVTFGGEDAAGLTVLSATAVDVAVPHSQTYTEGPVSVAVYSGTDVRAVRSEAPLEYTYRSLTDVDRQLQYAFAHWDDYNIDQYGDFTSWGGDCMDFVSQTLVARGWQPTPDWFNDAQQDWAPAFVDVPSFDYWLSAHPEYGAVRLDGSQRAQLKIGDIVMFDWDGDGALDHAQIVSGMQVIDGHLHIYLVGHTIDTDYRDLDEALATEGGPDAKVYFWSLPS